jgi:hypothetical protein
MMDIYFKRSLQMMKKEKSGEERRRWPAYKAKQPRWFTDSR